MTTARIRAAAVVPMSGVMGPLGRQAAAGLAAWARLAGARLTLVDCGDDLRRAAREARRLAPACDVLLGPYGSGPTRAVAQALRDEPWVLWNHGGAKVPPPRGRVVDVLAPAERYWTGLADVLAADGVPLDRVAIGRGASPFGNAVADGAVAALARAGAAPALEAPLADPAGLVRASAARGIRAVVAGGRPDEEIALGRALAGSGRWVGMVCCGVAEARAWLGDAVRGWVGPAQWARGTVPPPAPLPTRAGYPAAQALAAGLLAGQALATAGGGGPDALWAAALALRTRTFLGAFAVDAAGRQVAHVPALLRWGGDPLTQRVIWSDGARERLPG